MSLRILDASTRDGAAWVTRAFALFLKKPLAFSALLALFLFATLVFLVIPFVGPVLLLMALPLLSLGFMVAARSAQQGGGVHAGHLLEALRANDEATRARRKQLLWLCGLYAATTAAVLLSADWIDGGAFERLQVLMASARDTGKQKELDALLADGGMLRGLLWRVGGTALLSVPFWHAPALVWWQGQGLAQSLFSSTLACWRNRSAFLVYGLAWVLAILAFSVIAGSLFALFGAPQLATLAAVPAGLFFSTAFYVSLLFTYEGCFGAADAPRLGTGLG